MRPSSSTSSLDSQNDVEMAQLSMIPSSPDSYKHSGSPQSLLQDDNDDDYDDDRDDDDGGERALLSEDTSTRWEEKTPLDAAALWKQTSGIIIEVSASFRRQPTFPDPGALDPTNAPFHNNGQSAYGGIVRQDIRMFQSILRYPCALILRFAAGSTGKR